MSPLQDLWTHTDNGTAIRNITVHQVPAHGMVALLLKDAGDEPAGTQSRVPDLNGAWLRMGQLSADKGSGGWLAVNVRLLLTFWSCQSAKVRATIY
jgi:hypothetical protein